MKKMSENSKYLKKNQDYNNILHFYSDNLIKTRKGWKRLL